jgi:hypothetical protein
MSHQSRTKVLNLNHPSTRRIRGSGAVQSWQCVFSILLPNQVPEFNRHIFPHCLE